jgi:hypothetical protein
MKKIKNEIDANIFVKYSKSSKVFLNLFTLIFLVYKNRKQKHGMGIGLNTFDDIKPK